MDIEVDAVEVLRGKVTVKQSGTYPVITQVPAWVWRCELCGWLATGLSSEFAATREAANHAWEDHRVALCAKGLYGHAGHKWNRIPKSDSASRCERCDWVTSK